MRFLVVGGLSMVTDTGALFVFHGVARIWLPLATVLAFAVAFVVNFGLNRVWAFEGGAAGTNTIGTQLWRYLALVLANLVATVALVSTLTWAGLPYLVAKVVTAALLAVANYLVSRKWIFTSAGTVEVP
ncbi:GtrA family protein [Planosporangium flavigriseum]|uniref:GtrA family protein n=1 Tax=Planosporangium flavigriseum TaxID=373681 RepID=UPI001438F1B0|nr:GtrA family protein [Planosporangium flavigriseum]NJC65583.1 GtrA family protein [Planosporangium flavigriseum]